MTTRTNIQEAELLDLCRAAARIAARKWQLEHDEALSVAVVAALEHPQWWDGHTYSWIRQNLVSYIWAELVRRPRRMANAEQSWYAGLVPPASQSVANRAGKTAPCRRPDHVRVEGIRGHCKTCKAENNRRHYRESQDRSGRLEATQPPGAA